MSVSYYATVIHGIKITNSDLRKLEPNPEWNEKLPFNPATGKKHPEFIVARQYYVAEDLEKDYGLDFIQPYETDLVFIGIRLSAQLDLNYDDCFSPVSSTLVEQQIDSLRRFCKDMGLKDMKFSTWLVTCVG